MALEILSANPLLFHVLIVIASLALMAKASDLAVFGVSSYAHRLGLSDYIVGILVVSVASSLPELVSSITGAVQGAPGIVLGTLFGSNLAGLALVLGTSALFARKMNTHSKVLEGTSLIIWILVTLPFVLLLDGILSRADGIILVAAFVGYSIYLWRKEGKVGHIKKDVKMKSIWKSGFIFSLNLVVILLSARYLVSSSLFIASKFSITPYIIGLTVIAIGATLPDVMVGIRSIKQGHPGVGYGNVIGSMVIKALLFLGIIAIIQPIVFELSALLNLIIFRTVAVTLVLYWATKKFITWRQGLVLMGLYLAFIFIEIILV